MALLDVKNVKKIYTTRFGKNQVEALKNVTFRWKKENMWQLWESPVPERRRY